MSLSAGERSFRGLLGAQLFGAFNDNLFKALVLLLASRVLFPGADKQGVAFVVFALPFVLFSGVAGDLAERLSKRRVIVAMKWAEIGVMGAGVVALQLQSWPLLLAVLFVMGTQSAFFGPSKYGVLPELVEDARLLRANGLISMTTFMAALFGTALAGPLLDRFGHQMWLPGLVCVGFAVVGTALAARMGPLAPTQPALRVGLNPFGRLWGTLRALRGRPGLVPMVLLYSIFWFDAGVISQAINGMGAPAYLDIPLGQATRLSLLNAGMAVAIMAGSLLAPRLAARVPVGRLVLLGGAGMFVGQIMLWALIPILGPGPERWWPALAILGLIGLCGAHLVVPLQTYLQSAPPPGMRGQTFALNNFMNWLFMALGGVWYQLHQLGSAPLGPTVAQAGAGAVLMGCLWAFRGHVAALHIGEAR